MFQAEQTNLGLWRVRQIVDEPNVADDYYRIDSLPPKYRSGLYSVETQTTDFNCSVSYVVTAGRLQGIHLDEDMVSRKIGVTEMGVDPDQMYRSMTKMGIRSYLFENMSVEQLGQILNDENYAVIIDYQEPECTIEEKLSGDAGHYAMAFAIDSRGYVLLGESAYEGSSRIHTCQLQSHWYDVSLRTRKWFFGTGIVVPITYTRKYHPGTKFT
ncbi:MAG: hypothetical protein WAV40_01825 [Microgenomates group bacterium]